MADYKAPFFFKIRFYKASDTNKKKNSAHIRYIATRPGVDRGMEIDPDKNLEPEQLSLNLKVDDPPLDKYDLALRMVDEQIAESLRLEKLANPQQSNLEPDTAVHHIKYAHERPRSHGLFSSGDDEVNMGDIQSELSEHEGMVWRVIISLHGDDAKRLDMEKRGGWEETIRSQMPDMALKMGIQQSNLRWVAAYHPEEGHPHAHIVFWEKKPKRRMGKVNSQVQREMKKVYIDKIYAGDRDRHGKMKTEMRDKMRELGVVDLRGAVDFVRSWKASVKEADHLHDLVGSEPRVGLQPRVETKQAKYVSEKLIEISKILPERGRLMLKLMPEDVKEKVNELARWLYDQEQFKPLRSQYESSTEILARPYTSKENQLTDAVENAKADMIKRLAQVVLKASAEVGKENHFAVFPDKIKDVAEKILGAIGQLKSEVSEHLRWSILRGCVDAGMSKEDYYKLTADPAIPVYDSSYAEYSFRNTIEHEKKLSKGVYYLLHSQLGLQGAQEFLERLGYTKEAIKGFVAFKSALTEDTLAQAFGIADPQYKLIITMAKVLYAADMKLDEIRKAIIEWNIKSFSEVTQDKIDKALKFAEKEINESKDWGRTPVVKKGDFKSMCANLGIDAEYPWRSTKEREFLVRGHSTSVVEGIFKKALKQLVTESKKSEAEREREQQRVIKRIQVNADRDEDERDRKEKDRGR